MYKTVSKPFVLFCFLASPIPALSESHLAACQEIFDDYVDRFPSNLDECQAGEAEISLQECPPKPDGLVGTLSPPTHIVLALDSSGSMAGQLGGQSKMDIAKTEALSFLGEVSNNARISLVLYGHKGSNEEAGKAESCASSEFVHEFGTPFRELDNTIAGLRPVGWTPLGGVLEFLEAEMSGMAPVTEGKPTSPVIYLISDGEETCDGDPVAAARRLSESGVPVTVNTIGFDADGETRAQLEAIAEAGGGTYHPADDAAALRRELRAISEATGEIARYNYCVIQNAAHISSAHQKVASDLMQCFGRNDPTKMQTTLMRDIRKADDGSQLEQCGQELGQMARHHASESNTSTDWIKTNHTPVMEEAIRAADTYIIEMGLVPVPK